MNISQVGGIVQVATGLLALFYQGWALFHGTPAEFGHIGVGAGLVAGGAAHLSNGRH